MVIGFLSQDSKTALNHSLMRTHSDYTKVNRLEHYKILYKKAVPAAVAFAGIVTLFRFLGDKLV